MKKQNINLKNLDNVSKIVLIVLVSMASYLLILLIVGPFFESAQTSMMRTMNEMMDVNIMNFSTTNSIIINLISLVLGIGLGFLTSLYLFRTRTEDREYHILRKALSDDERKILDEIKKAGKITQDSLRFRLNWSKAKISTILTNLDKRGLVQRERTGKTYRVHLQKMV